ncbi:abortive infection family protein [Fibrivirga algicola]|uniref:Abortive infection family protein n=1 Tax=Fibrivirga algicola TaxID=2950420 RepID=A0ABX0QAS5_9BACT|nr:abortive infection family protein [Fibrivirga algicola]NID08922.1 abortive infection family protein [Fibrivirga algicola]
MAKINYRDRQDLEKLLQMRGGYILDFSDSTFRSFVHDVVERDISDEKYKAVGNSKANRLRTFWDLEPNHVVGNLIYELVLIAKDKPQKYDDLSGVAEFPHKDLIDRCFRIASTLKGDSIIEDIDAIQAINSDKDFSFIAKSIRESIERNEPESALDRLHTFVMKLVRTLCEQHGVVFSKEEYLDAIFGKYVRHIRNNKMIESEMAEKILVYSISVIQSFNDIRNNRSFANDNPVLNYDESILIFNNVTNMVRFINKIEDKIPKPEDFEGFSSNWEELPF